MWQGINLWYFLGGILVFGLIWWELDKLAENLSAQQRKNTKDLLDTFKRDLERDLGLHQQKEIGDKLKRIESDLSDIKNSLQEL